MDKKGRFGSLVFIVIAGLPLLALLLMDFELSRANDITGAYLAGGVQAYVQQNVFAGAAVICFVLLLITGFAFAKIRRSNAFSTPPLAKINEDIKRIEDKLR